MIDSNVDFVSFLFYNLYSIDIHFYSKQFPPSELIIVNIVRKLNSITVLSNSSNTRPNVRPKIFFADDMHASAAERRRKLQDIDQ